MVNPFRIFGLLNRDHIIQQNVRREKDIIYGARAMNIQLPIGFQRNTQDFDIYSKTPKRNARRLERVLDKQQVGNYYYVKPAMHSGTWKLMDVGADNKRGTMDDYGVADYTKPDRKIKSVSIGNVRYAALSERKTDAIKSLKDKMFEFRHEKDRKDLYRIRKGLEVLRW